MPILLSERLLHPSVEYQLVVWPSVLAYWVLPFPEGQRLTVHHAGLEEGDAFLSSAQGAKTWAGFLSPSLWYNCIVSLGQ